MNSTTIVLIVDDDSTVSRTLSRMLKAKKPDWRIYTVNTFKMARRICRTTLPDIVILDENLPDGNCFDLLSELKNFDPEIPVIMMSGPTRRELKSRTPKNQAYIMLEKTFLKCIEKNHPAPYKGQAQPRKEDKHMNPRLLMTWLI